MRPLPVNWGEVMFIFGKITAKLCSCGSHFGTDFCTFFAGVSTLFAAGMMLRMFSTFCGTGGTNFGTQCVELMAKFRTSGVKSCTQCTDIGTIATQNDAALIANFDTIGDASFAGDQTGQTSINTAFQIFHSRLIFIVNEFSQCNKYQCLISEKAYRTMKMSCMIYALGGWFSL
jgi:hypothetical protein